MVVNDQSRFVFVHIPKTAGTSVMAALEQLPGHNPLWAAATKHETLAEFHSAVPQRRNQADHMRALDPLAYRTFAFVRNPWERMSSLYRYLKESRPRQEIDTVGDFADFLTQAVEGVAWLSTLHSLRQQVDFFTREGAAGPTLHLHYLGHFEHLAEDVPDVARRLGIRLELERRNESTNTRRDFRADYTDRMREIVGRLFAADAETFGYSPDARHPARRYSGPIDAPRPPGAVSR